MSIWDKIQDIIGTDNKRVRSVYGIRARDISQWAFVDIEVGQTSHGHKVYDIGSIRYDSAVFHTINKQQLIGFLRGVDFVIGHNIIHHDMKYLFEGEQIPWRLVDTLYISPLLFPERPYHRLVKDDKLLKEDVNNPVNDCKKAYDLWMEEVTAWKSLSLNQRRIYVSLLGLVPEFEGFIEITGESEIPLDSHHELSILIRESYSGKLCSNADFVSLIENHPVELAYALALIGTSDHRSITPGWVTHRYPFIEEIVRTLRHNPCGGCEYCLSKLNILSSLKYFFNYDHFREYEGEPLQEKAVSAAVEGKSLLAIFPTGGGKSLTFQLPALIEGESVHGLTVVISPLQSLMKDQVDNLNDRGITSAVTINGLLDPISRSIAIERVISGDASILYIAPEMLRSRTIERILMVRHVVRFVIDEAHCFSSWGQDFRVDYLYIGKFIREYQKRKGITRNIPISCFTATAKQKVVQDICDYFKKSLDLNLEIFASTATRTNLHYSVIHAESDDDKYQRLRELISGSSCPVIVYVARTRKTVELAAKLSRDGYQALPFNGKMEVDEKISNQDAFMSDNARIIVATSAFGMGVDKKDVGLVIHYDISDSLENYVQESGRAGRDPQLNARCYVLYCDNDLDKHFVLLNQTKLSISEIQQIWKAVKNLTHHRSKVCSSALEIARQAGWDDSVKDVETRVRTAIAALEQGGYLERGNNVPHVFATGIIVKNVDEARRKIADSVLFSEDEVEKSVRIIKSLISKKYTTRGQGDEAESRVDYLADILGLTKNEVISCVERMRQAGILADTKDISAFLVEGDSRKKATNLQQKFWGLEQYLLTRIQEKELKTSCKQLNDDAIKAGIVSSTEKNIRTILNFLAIKGYITKKEDGAHNIEIELKIEKDAVANRFRRRIDICRFALDWLYQIVNLYGKQEEKTRCVQFSVVQLLQEMQKNAGNLFSTFKNLKIEDVEESLFYLSKIGVLRLEGGFLVLYNAMDIRRIKDNKFRYKQDDYRMLNEFYKQKIQQVHIVGEYANLMVKDYSSALLFVKDYFQLDYQKFISKYFRGERLNQIQRNITPDKYNQIFGALSERQMDIISDKESRCIVVAAGPGSGKTRVLVHKLASLLLLEDVKHEQLLMLTFSRAAANEFRQRLIGLIGEAGYYVEIKTFHSYAFDLLGRVGNLEDADDVVKRASELIENGEVEPSRIGKTVLVIDEAQDMGYDEFSLVSALMKSNEEMRVIAVGDDDQNIYEFRGSDSGYMNHLKDEAGSRFIEMTDNYRSASHIVNVSNSFVQSIHHRMKSTPIHSIANEDGFVHIVQYSSEYMYEPLAEDLILHRGSDTACVLTNTNQEAAIVVALLKKRGVAAKLVQSMDGIRFWNLAEMRYFIKCIDDKLQTPLITDEIWEDAKRKTFARYAQSDALAYVRRCAEIFESTNHLKYVTDFKESVFESSIEDFGEYMDSEVVVSTIHKAKGREFDQVYMLLSGEHEVDDNLRRRYYVGMTRAKRRLSIHTNSALFKEIGADAYQLERKQYSMPDEIVIQLSHKDVVLDFFKAKKRNVLGLMSGMHLRYSNFYIIEQSNNISVAKLSKSMQQVITQWSEKGYGVVDVKVRFIVAWKSKEATEDEQETAVLLADLILKKNN